MFENEEKILHLHVYNKKAKENSRSNNKEVHMRKRLLLVFILCLGLVFSSCSKAEDKKSDVTTNTTTESKPDTAAIKEKAAAKESGSLGDTTTEPIIARGDSDDPVESAVVPESTATYDTLRDGDMILSEKFSIKGGESTGADGSVYEYGTADAEADGYSDDILPIGDDYIDPTVPVDPYEPEPIITEAPKQVKSGTLTAGEWNDNRNYDFIKKLLADGQNYDYKTFFTQWELSPFNRLEIVCKDSSETALQGVKVTVYDANGNSLVNGVTDQNGTFYAYYALLDADIMPAKVHAEYGDSSADYDVESNDLIDGNVINLTLDASRKQKTLDLMFTVDTTGSMGDEIFYLQAELQDVIKRVQNDTANIPVRLSVNFYRDKGDEYVVRPYDFSTDINTQLAYLNKEYADGGGDFEEAVEEALENAINEHSWDEDSIKLMFLVLDAPPHRTKENIESLKKSIARASEMGIRIIPVASSGIDKDTEFLLRAFAMTTGGTYTFLTDHSGVGGSHLEPTIGEYEVEQLNDLLVRLIEEYLR